MIWELAGRRDRRQGRPEARGTPSSRWTARRPADCPLTRSRAHIRGRRGRQVKLTVERADGKRVQDVSLKRVQIAEPAFKSQLLPGNVPYLRLFSFSQNGQTDLLQAIREYEAKNPPAGSSTCAPTAGGAAGAALPAEQVPQGRPPSPTRWTAGARRPRSAPTGPTSPGSARWWSWSATAPPPRRSCSPPRAALRGGDGGGDAYGGVPGDRQSLRAGGRLGASR